MCKNELVRAIVIPAIGDYDYNSDAVFSGIDAYTRDNGFDELDSRFNEGVIKSVIKNNLSSVLNMRPESIVLFFSNYRLIEEVRIINNKSLALAEQVRNGVEPASEELRKIEVEFNNRMAEVCGIEGLRAFLEVQISEIILNLDYAKGVTEGFSQRLSSK